MDRFITPEFYEQRASTRYPVALFVEFENGIGWTRDVSTTGACIETAQVFDQGVAIRFYLHIPNEYGDLARAQFQGVVIRLESTAEGRRLGVLIEEILFEFIDEWRQSNISHNNILIISENSSGAYELSRQLAGKGYNTVNAPPSADLKSLNREHPVLIVIVDCPDTCVSITEHLRLNSLISDIPVICMSDRVCSGKPSNVEQIVTGEFLSKSAAFDALESRIQFCLHNKHTLSAESLPEPAFHERRQCERRKPANLTEQTQDTYQSPPPPRKKLTIR